MVRCPVSGSSTSVSKSQYHTMLRLAPAEVQNRRQLGMTAMLGCVPHVPQAQEVVEEGDHAQERHSRMKPPRSLFEDVSDFAESSVQWMGRTLTPAAKKDVLFSIREPAPRKGKR